MGMGAGVGGGGAQHAAPLREWIGTRVGDDSVKHDKRGEWGERGRASWRGLRVTDATLREAWIGRVAKRGAAMEIESRGMLRCAQHDRDRMVDGSAGAAYDG
jgi:hypothetical protein